MSQIKYLYSVKEPRKEKSLDFRTCFTVDQVAGWNFCSGNVIAFLFRRSGRYELENNNIESVRILVFKDACIGR